MTASTGPLFLLFAVAYSCPWTAVSSELGRLSLQFGPGILLQASLAWFLPSLPILSLQLLLDERFDTQYGLFRTSVVRAAAGFGGCALAAAAYPLHTSSAPWLLFCVALMGACSAVAFGTCQRLAARQPPQAVLALSLGYVASGPAVLVAEALLRIGPRCGRLQLLLLYRGFVAPLCLAALAAVVWDQARLRRGRLVGPTMEEVLPAAWPELGEAQEEPAGPALQRLSGSRAPDSVGAALHSSTLEQPLLGPLPLAEHAWAADGGGGGGGSNCGKRSSTLEQPLLGPLPLAEHAWAADGGGGGGSNCGKRSSTLDVLRQVWPAAAALAVSVGSSMLLFPLFTYVQSSGWLGDMLPQALFWSRVFADIGGRLASGALPLTSPPALLALGALKLGLAPLLPLYICGGLPWLSTSWVEGDAAALAFVALQWLVSGYVNSCCALAAPRLVRPALARRAASLMALVFQAGCLAGLLGALPLQRWVGG